jgi:hypothetical protein
MRLELSDGDMFELSENEVWALYETLLERARQPGAISAARQLRPALSWSSGVETRVAFDQFETEAVQAVRETLDLAEAQGRTAASLTFCRRSSGCCRSRWRTRTTTARRSGPRPGN